MTSPNNDSGPLADSTLRDLIAITRNVSKFALRDQGRWDELRELFHPDALIAVTWYSGPIAGFIEASAQMSAAGARVLTRHSLGAPRVTISGNRSLSDTDVTILNRSFIGPVEVDVTSHLRFFDRFERRGDGVWRVLSRVAVYEKDRMDPVAPSLLFPVLYRLARFHRFPRPYRHLAAGLLRKGYSLAAPILEAGTGEEADLWREARLWLNSPQ